MYEFLRDGIYPRLCQWLTVSTDGGAIGLYLGCFALCILLGYLLGSVNSAILVSRILYHDDIRRHGSGNAGTTNMLRVYGPLAAVLTLLGDLLKTALALLLSYCILGADWVGYGFSMSTPAFVTGLFCIVGHIFPLYHHFKGGKGVLCAAVVIGMLSPWLLLILLPIFVLTVVVTKYVSLGSLLASACYPLFYNGLIKMLFSSTPPGEITLLTFAITILLIWAHRQNITRLMHHEEHRISFHRSFSSVVGEIAGEIADPPARDEDSRGDQTEDDR
jgi:glycerol-3-phosphate acyltransferase PlsY